MDNILSLKKPFHIISWNSQETRELGREGSIHPILEMRKLRFEGDKWLAHDPIAYKPQDEASYPPLLIQGLRYGLLLEE